MRIAHSFWSVPLKEKFFGDKDYKILETRIYYALSVYYVHNNGYEIDLYTDKDGAKILEGIPYDNIYIIENSITDKPYLAASIKFEALKRMQLGDVLIDGDLFLTQKPVYDILEKQQYDICASTLECIDDVNTQNSRRISTFLYNSTIWPFRNLNWSAQYNVPDYKNLFGFYNTSVMQFNNQQLKDEYILQYIQSCKIIEDSIASGVIDFNKQSEDNKVWPDILIEQLHLTQLIENSKYTIQILDKYKTDKYCDYIGFFHAGGQKAQLYESIKNILKSNSIELYNIATYENAK
jgi:hypothetical protein